MMKRLIKLMISLLLAGSLAGCMKYKMNVDVNADGKAATDVKVMLSEDFIKNYLKTTDDKVVRTFSSSLKKSAKNAKITKIKEKHDRLTYVGVEAQTDDSADIQTKVKNGKVFVTIPVANITNALSESGLSQSALNNKSYTPASLEAAGVEVSLQVNMPGKPVTNIGTIKDQTVKVDLLKEMMKSENQRVKTIRISSPTNKYRLVLIIGAIIGAAVIVVLLLLFIRRRKNKKKDTDE